MKRETKKRQSNRIYTLKKCAKPECEIEFNPTDARQIYCCRQHQIDSNNDKRKIITSHQADFDKKVKNNRKTLIKIYNNDLYKKHNTIHKTVLDYEDYSFGTFHSIKIESKSDREVYFCFEYGLMLIDSEKQLYKIYKNE